jgi:hypothetical protein
MYMYHTSSLFVCSTESYPQEYQRLCLCKECVVLTMLTVLVVMTSTHLSGYSGGGYVYVSYVKLLCM